MDLYPAIDIRGGGAVRLRQGDFDRETAYGDPVTLARRFAAAGAPWLHVVDLDAAREGNPVNRATVLAIAQTVTVPVETGGGVRTAEDVEVLLAGGVRRVVLGTVALEDPGLVRTLAERHPGRVAVGIDYRRGTQGRTEVAVRGWEQPSGRSVAEVVDELTGTGVAALIVTAIDRDGTLAGPDLEGLSEVLGTTGMPVIASGGVGSAADIEALAGLAVPVRAPTSGADPGRDEVRRLSGVITGKALVDGRMTVEEGVTACAPSG
jgi:phosphoribosylformimino-5-aminoimidazole carboxamide ribotide isomerase